MTDIEQKIEYLQILDEAYYNGSDPLVTDVEYDILKAELMGQVPDHPYFETVGAPIKGDKVKLPYLLGSLKKVKTDTVDKWMDSHSGVKVISGKADGVSLYVKYVDGNVTLATTRGDGYEGQDITEKAQIFCPTIKGNGEFRGEATLCGNTHTELGYKTRRNGVAGLLNDDKVNRCEHIVPVFYEVLHDVQDMTEWDRFLYMGDLGLQTVPFTSVKNASADELAKLLEVTKNSVDYDVDGLVISLNVQKRENTYYPTKKVAFKVNESAVLCTVTEVKWNVGRSGKITPVVHIEPTEIQGVTVSKCTGFNWAFINGSGISKGAEVYVVRSGDVIPYIEEVKVSVGHPTITKCPDCGAESYLSESGIDMFCYNTSCGETAYKKVEYFLRTLGAENITIKTLKKLNINTIEKAYELDELDIIGLEGFGKKRAQQVVEEIQKTKKTTSPKMLQAFGIPGIGQAAAEDICNKYHEQIFDLSMNELQTVKGIGVKTSANYNLYIGEYKDLITRLNDSGIIFEMSTNDVETDAQNETELTGLIFTLTGAYEIKRNILKNMIEGKQASVKSLTKKSNYLVTSDMNSTSSKMKKAQKYGTEIISYEDLLEMLGEDK